MSGKGTVLVTGGSGYIGGWCIVGLLNQGYTVRTTIRSLAREAEVRAWLSKHADTTALTFHAADLMNDAGWDEAAAGCDYMLHVASPLGIAEKTAWDLIKASDGKTTLATVNPALVLGPVMGKDFSDSLQVLERLLTGRVPGIPRLGFSIVDVRDVADLHIRAMTDPAAAGERFIAATSWAWMSDLADILRANLPAAAAAKVPTRKMPDIVMRLVGLMDRDLASAGDRLGKKADYTSAKAQKLLGWAPRPVKDTVMETANSLIAEGVA
ncbi:MAG: NAD-dependent epimerase/dehydratase family protein [Caulobacteraceae bacterium]